MSEAQRRGLGRGLGRGLASLIPVTEPAPANLASVSFEKETSSEVSEESKKFRMIPIQDILANPNQPRKHFDDQKIEELSLSIREKGIIQPVLVTRRGDKYELVSGERRLRASMKAGLSEIPAVIRDAEPKESLELAIIENVQREDLDPIEEAMAYQELVEKFGYTQEEVSQKVGKDRTTVANTLRLLRLPTKVKEALRTGDLTEGHARALLGVPEMEKQIYFADCILKEGWSVRELEARIQSKRVLKATGRKRQAPVLSPMLVQILDDLRRRLGTQVRMVPVGKKGKIIIEYYSEDDLNRIYSTLKN